MSPDKKKASQPHNNATNEAGLDSQDQSDDVLSGVTLESVSAATQDADKAADMQEQLAAAQEEIAKLKDAFLRAKAEEDNVRRRSEREIATSRKFAVEGFASEMLNVHDSLKLACSVDLGEDADQALKSIQEGVQLTLKQLDAALTKFSVIQIAAEAGEKLDPNLHQAMSLIESDQVASGCIIDVIQPGFQLHDRLLRPTLVVVAK